MKTIMMMTDGMNGENLLDGRVVDCETRSISLYISVCVVDQEDDWFVSK